MVPRTTNSHREHLRFTAHQLSQFSLFLDATTERKKHIGWQLLTFLPKLLAAEVIAWSEVDLVTSTFSFRATRALPLANSNDFVLGENLWQGQVLMPDQPLLQHYLRTRTNSACKMSDLMTSREFHRTRIYGAWYRPMGIEDVIHLFIPASTRSLLHMGVARSEPFDATEHLLFNLATIHLMHNRTLSQAPDSAPGDMSESSQSRVGILVTDYKWRIQFVSPQAGTWLEDSFDESLIIDRPAQRFKEWVERQALPSSHSDNDVNVIGPLYITREHWHVTVYLFYLPQQLLFTFEGRLVDFAAESLSKFRSLTEREAELLRMMASGLSTPEIAVRSGISSLTVKKHLEHIYRKLGVHNRLAAISVMLKALPVMNLDHLSLGQLSDAVGRGS